LCWLLRRRRVLGVRSRSSSRSRIRRLGRYDASRASEDAPSYETSRPHPRRARDALDGAATGDIPHSAFVRRLRLRLWWERSGRSDHPRRYRPHGRQPHGNHSALNVVLTCINARYGRAKPYQLSALPSGDSACTLGQRSLRLQGISMSP
jgi:hypothetical protein